MTRSRPQLAGRLMTTVPAGPGAVPRATTAMNLKKG
jgi:hypothetical protein